MDGCLKLRLGHWHGLAKLEVHVCKYLNQRTADISPEPFVTVAASVPTVRMIKEQFLLTVRAVQLEANIMHLNL
jgi:hypothetical protein